MVFYVDGANDENISSLEEIALRNLKELEVKQDQRSEQLNNLFNEIKEDEISRHEKEERIREENKRKANEEHKMRMNENQVRLLKMTLGILNSQMINIDFNLKILKLNLGFAS